MGEWRPRIWKFLLGLICAALLAAVAYLIYLVVSAPAADEASHSAQLAGDGLNFLLNALTVSMTAVTAFQVYMMKDINHMEMSHNIFDDNQTFRRDMHKAHEQLRELSNALTPATDFDETYLLAKWEDLRAFAYHHEYMGYLVFRNRLNFDIVFDTVAFPNWLINSPEAKKVIAAGREHTPDFWNGSTHLYLCYEIRRKYNKRNALRQDWKRFPAAQRRKAKKALIKAEVLAQAAELTPLTAEYTAENVLKHLWVTKKEFKDTRAAWKAQYITLPE